MASLFDNVVAWTDFIQQIIIAYRGIVDAFWGPIVELLPFHSPRWLHDYLTICGLTAIAVLWALHRTSVELGFDNISSTFGAIRRMFFDFSVGKSALASFEVKARDEQRLGYPITKDIADLIGKLARKNLPWVWRVFNVFWISALVLIVPIAPYILPFLMYARDRADIARARKLFGLRRTELASAILEPAIRNSLSEIFKKQVDSFLTFEAINQIYYRMVMRNQLWYYAAVLVFFLMLVFINYVVIRIRSG